MRERETSVYWPVAMAARVGSVSEGNSGTNLLIMMVVVVIMVVVVVVMVVVVMIVVVVMMLAIRMTPGKGAP